MSGKCDADPVNTIKGHQLVRRVPSSLSETRDVIRVPRLSSLSRVFNKRGLVYLRHAASTSTNA